MKKKNFKNFHILSDFAVGLSDRAGTHQLGPFYDLAKLMLDITIYNVAVKKLLKFASYKMSI